MIVIQHVCSIHSLFSIVQGGVFKPTYPDPLAADAGLNCYIKGEKYGFSNTYEGSGCILSLEWLGPVSERDVHFPTPYPTDELLNQPPWRAFVPINNDPKLLKVHGYQIAEESWEEVVSYPKWLKYVPYFGNFLIKKRRTALEDCLNKVIGNHIAIRY
ncbi:hypothetical protein [Rheinheimera oceanensis]|jgi:hypothetical protein|uniref:hypothetical protein n=1 Tax=Rheinheimera oceanensis TaxID=2817449 RepID=UPI001BFEA57C|nr:hypothetical protein [Rheinheimera oceanensis]